MKQPLQVPLPTMNNQMNYLKIFLLLYAISFSSVSCSAMEFAIYQTNVRKRQTSNPALASATLEERRKLRERQTHHEFRMRCRLTGGNAPLPSNLQNSDADYSEQPAKKE